MGDLNILSAAEQVAEHLRDGLLRGTWSGEMPGTPQLAAELGIDRKTITAALGQLEEEGLLVSQGIGKPRRIAPRSSEDAAPTLRLGILEYSPPDLVENYMIALVDKLGAAGHGVFFAPKTLTEMGMKVARIRRMVESTEADAWLVGAASHQILDWFSKQPTPAFAFFGRMEGLDIAGTKPDKPPAIAKATRQLIALGHRRIITLGRGSRRIPSPGRFERAFLSELESHGIPTGDYHLPHWDETVDGYEQLLASLFSATPPTALIIDDTPMFVAAQQFLGNRGIRIPEDISMICTDGNPAFSLCKQAVAHIHWDYRPVVRRIVNWVGNVARGKDDRRQSFTKAEFVEGGTIGPARRSK